VAEIVEADLDPTEGAPLQGVKGLLDAVAGNPALANQDTAERVLSIGARPDVVFGFPREPRVVGDAERRVVGERTNLMAIEVPARTD
jgi:hypothetical protein